MIAPCPTANPDRSTATGRQGPRRSVLGVAEGQLNTAPPRLPQSGSRVRRPRSTELWLRLFPAWADRGGTESRGRRMATIMTTEAVAARTRRLNWKTGTTVQRPAFRKQTLAREEVPPEREIEEEGPVVRWPGRWRKGNSRCNAARGARLSSARKLLIGVLDFRLRRGARTKCRSLAAASSTLAAFRSRPR